MNWKSDTTMRTLLRSMAILVVINAACHLHAGIVLVNDPSMAFLGASQDGFNITRDVTNGIDWLDFSLTESRSFNNVSADLGVGGPLNGWRYATAADFALLGISAGIPAAVIDAFDALPAPAQLVTLANALGITRPDYGGAVGIFDEPGVTAGNKRFGGVAISAIPGAIFDIPNDPKIWFTQDVLVTGVSSSAGSALVRSSATTREVSLPEPASLALVCLGAVSCTIIRRTNIRRHRVG